MQEMYKKLKEFGHVRLNEPLSKHTTFKIGGPADFFIEIDDSDKLMTLLNFLSGEGVEYFVLGGGSNILFSDEGFRGVVIKIQDTRYKIQDELIETGAGTLLSVVVSEASKNNLSGLEWAVGIPGTVGGAVRGNAGAMGHDTASVLQKVVVWRDGEVLELSNSDCGFIYRGSNFKEKGGVIVRAYFKLSLGDKKEIVEEMSKYLKQRTGRYPKEPNAGSFFQNVPVSEWRGDMKDLPEIFVERKKIPVGWLVEQLDLKGFTVGGAKVSPEHGNFIINFDSATQADVLAVVETVKEKVYNKFGIELHPEVEILI